MRISLPVSLRNLIAALHDSTMAAVSFLLALYLRLGSDQFDQATPYLLLGTASFTCICMAVFVSMRLYRGLWQYASLRDMLTLVKSVTVAEILFVLVMFSVTRLEGMPRSLPVINWLVLLFLLAAPRIAYRALKERSLFFNFRHDISRQIPVLIAGINSAAEAFIRDTLRNPRSAYRVVGIIDEKSKRRGRSIHGVTIYGASANLPSIIAQLKRRGLKPQRLVLADADVDGARATRLLELTEPLGLTLGRLPDIQELKKRHGEKCRYPLYCHRGSAGPRAERAGLREPERAGGR